MDTLAGRLTRFSRLNSFVLEETATARSSTSAEDVVLATLLRDGPVLSPTALKRLVIQSPGGLTKTLLRLERSGLIRRQPDATDRRSLLVVLTAKGRRAAERSVASFDAHYDRLLADLDARERETMSTLVRKVLDRLELSAGMASSRR